MQAGSYNGGSIRLLGKIATKLGVDTSGDPSISVLQQATRPEKLIEQIDESITKVRKPAPNERSEQ